MVIFQRVNAEIAPEVADHFPGEDLVGKTAFFSDSIITKRAETIKNLEIGLDNDIITVSGTWSDISYARAVIKEWLEDLDKGETSLVNESDQEKSPDSPQHDGEEVELDTAKTKSDEVLPGILENIDLVRKTVLGKVGLKPQKPKPVVITPIDVPVKRKRGRPSKYAIRGQAKVTPTDRKKAETSSETETTASPDGDKPSVSPRKRAKVQSEVSEQEASTSGELPMKATKDDALEDGEIPFDDGDDDDADAAEIVEESDSEVEEPIDNEELSDSEKGQIPKGAQTYNLTNDQQYACIVCDYKSPKLLYLQNHVDRLHAAKRYKCPVCPKTFGLKKAYRDHYSYNHKNHRHRCAKCEKTFPKAYLLKAHIEKEHTEKTKESFILESNKFTHQCPQCDFIAKHPRYLSAHQARVHSEKTLVCPLCDRRYATDRDLRWHIKTHTFTFTCHVCGRQLKSKQALTQHLHAIHKEGDMPPKKEKTYLCVTCGKLCKNRTMYTMHINKVHLNVKPHTCPQCEMGFFSKSSLKQHLLTHSDKRTFECDECGKCFKQRQGLRLHQVIHRGSRPHKCSECGKAFTQNGALIRHRRIHTGERPYPCSMCEAKFSDYSILRRHLQGIHKIDDTAFVRKEVLDSMSKARNAVKSEPGETMVIPRRGPGGKLTPVVRKAEVVEEEALEPDPGECPTPGTVQEYQTIGQELTLLSQPTQLYLDNTLQPQTVFVEQAGGLTCDIQTVDGMEQVIVMNPSTEGVGITTTTTEDSKDAVLISPETLANVAAMYEHEGTIYALVQEQPLNT